MNQVVVKIKDVCEFVRGLTYSKSDEVDFSKNAVLRATNIDLNSNRLNLTDIRYIDNSVSVKTDKKVKINDILICTASGSKSHLGKVALIEEPLDMAFGGFMGVLRAKPNINPKYLFAFFKSEIFLKHVFNTGDGANINNLKFSQFEDLEFVLPSLQIQKKIVEKLDAIFAEIDKATAAAETNAKNAEALFQSYLTEVFESGGEGWKETKFGDIADFRNGINFLKSERGVTIKILGVKDFQKNFIAPLGSLETVTLDSMVSDNDLIKDGDILFVRSNGNLELIGRCMLVENLNENTTFSGFTIRARLNDEYIYPKFVCFYLKSERIRRKMIDSGNGANIKSLNQTSLSNIIFQIPHNFDIQVAIVSRLQDIECQASNLKASYLSKIGAFSLYKRSILKQAFNGELVKE